MLGNSQLNESNNNSSKTHEEIKEIIKKALINNSIIGFLHNNLLYMKAFGKENSIDKVFYGIGLVTILGGTQYRELDFDQGLSILVIGIGSFIIGSILSHLVKYYLVYDIDREVFYTITNVFNKTVKKTPEINKRDIIGLGVNVVNKTTTVRGQKAEDISLFNFSKDMMDNPVLLTSFVALQPNGKIVNISDPVALRKPHEAAVARCELFSECFGVDSVICNKNETLKAFKEGNKYKLVKYSMDKHFTERNKNAKNTMIALLLMFGFLIIGVIAICLFIKSLK